MCLVCEQSSLCPALSRRRHAAIGPCGNSPRTAKSNTMTPLFFQDISEDTSSSILCHRSRPIRVEENLKFMRVGRLKLERQSPFPLLSILASFWS